MRRLSELYPLFVVGLAVLLTGEPSPFTYLMRLLALLLTAFSMVLLLAHLVYINYFAGHGGSVTEVLSKWASTLDNPRLTWQVIKEHYGPWAWPKPGP